ncbi:MAG: O-antigen polysaccharide polymerase Wzy [Rubrobacter sp.]
MASVRKDSRHRTPPARHGRWALAFFGSLALLVLLIVLALLYSVSAFGLSAAHTLRMACLLLALSFLWSLYSWKLASGGLFNPYGLFLISAALFNGGQIFLYLFAIDTSRLTSSLAISVPETFSQETVLLTVYLITLGIVGFHTGGLLSVPLASRRGMRARSAWLEDDRTTAFSLRLVGWGLLAVSAIPTIFLLQQTIAVVLSSGYLGIYQQSFGSAVSILAAAIVPAAIFLLAGSRGITFNILLSTFIVIAYSLIQFSLGNRAGAAMFLIAYAWTFHRSIRPLPTTALLGMGIFMMFVVFPVVRLLRGGTGGPRNLSFETLAETFSSIDNPLVSVFQEMGFSVITVAHTVEMVPGFRDFDYGVSYFYGALGVIPSLFWDSHPTIVHGTLASWLARTAEPGLVSVYPNWSLGYSFIAEAYLNFGWIGAPLALGVMGFLLGWFVLSADRSGDLARIAMVGAFTGFFLIFARAESNDIIRPLFWYSLFPYWTVCLLRWWPYRKPLPLSEEEAEVLKARASNRLAQ